MPRIIDIFNARKRKKCVCHIVGDVHYLTFLLDPNKTILTIHDCEMINRESGLKRYILKLFWLKLPLMRARYIVAISEKTKSDIIRLSGIDGRKVSVIDNPISPKYFPVSRNSLCDIPIVLHIGTKENKNLARLVAACAGLSLKLLIVGRLGEDDKKLIDDSRIIYDTCHDLSDEEMLSCYHSANALSFVSLSEGFGLPIIEAQATELPVVTSHLEPMISVAGRDGAVFVDPYNIEDIRNGINSVLFDASVRDRLVKAGRENVMRYESSNVARKYAELYRRVNRGGG